jgi:hypothetical protein
MEALTEFYVELLRDLQEDLLSDVRRPFRPKGWSDERLRRYAARMAEAHLVAPFLLAQGVSAR